MKATQPRNILVCTVGASWAVVPEVLGFVAPNLLALYEQHPQREALERSRSDHGIAAPDELWLITTAGRLTEESVSRVQRWWELLGKPLPLRIWIAEDTDQLASSQECLLLRELTFRVVLAARQHCAGGKLLLSLAGGRKTMSADLQAAGAVLGAHALLHVVGPEPLPDWLRGDPRPELFTAPLPPDRASAIVPVVVGKGQWDETLQVPNVDGTRVASEWFPVPLEDCVVRWRPPQGARWLTGEIERRQRDGASLVRNFVSAMTSGDAYPNWTWLLRLPPALLDQLRATTVAGRHRSLLHKLPKIDLHRHLGGCLDLKSQRLVGRALWEELTQAEQQRALEELRQLGFVGAGWPADWPQRLRKSSQRSALCAALLALTAEEVLEAHLYGSTEPRVALKRRHPAGFSAYERPGELVGSAVLSNPASLQIYAKEVVRLAAEEGLVAVELRGSPHKYDPEDPAGFVRRLRDALVRAGASVGNSLPPGAPSPTSRPHVGFIWILDRRDQAGAEKVMQAAVRAHEEMDGFLVGLDLAGDERCSSPQQWGGLFTPAFQQCLFVTVHAGEDEPAENIWEAAYHMHADRIGHGLTLHKNSRLMARFRERRICLELCPTSNIEVAGYRDPARPQTEELPSYPLRALMEAGLPLTLCTDNPGISRTTLPDEYLTASRIVPGGLSMWEALALMRQAFERSFLPAPVRTALMQSADVEVARIIGEGEW